MHCLPCRLFCAASVQSVLILTSVFGSVSFHVLLHRYELYILIFIIYRIYSKKYNSECAVMSSNDFLDIDGSVLEGGGQILRISISLSAILGIPVRVTKIRAGRKKPGLSMQHLTGMQLVGQMCGAALSGDYVGSTEIGFRPNKLKGGNYFCDAVTAGSVSLLLQVALPCALLADAPVCLELRGGTNAEMAPQIDYITEVFLPALRNFGADFDLTVNRRGFFPKGGGSVRVLVNPVRLFRPVTVTKRGDVTNIRGYSFVGGTMPIELAERAAEGAKYELCDEGSVHIECNQESLDFAPHNGYCIILACNTSGGCVLGADGVGRRAGPGAGAATKRATEDAAALGRAAGAALREQIRSGACLDTHAQDQVILYMALASGASVVRVGDVTQHTRTAIYVAESIAKTKFEIRQDGLQNLIECTGLGIINRAVATT